MGSISQMGLEAAPCEDLVGFGGHLLDHVLPILLPSSPGLVPGTSAAEIPFPRLSSIYDAVHHGVRNYGAMVA